MRRLLLLSLSFSFACSLVVDGKLDDKEAGSLCTGADDGTPCDLGDMSGAAICRSQVCVLSECGDSIVDPNNGEECDDGNEASGDGCEPGSCELSCTTDADCNDERVCNGSETCNVGTNVCDPGDPAADETACVLDEGGDGQCRSGTCRVIGCGNGLPDGGEECDDGNEVSNDGCEPDCTITCMNDEDCVPLDTSVCDGVDTCDVGTNTCVPGESLDCDDGEACTADSCDPLEGCINDPLPFDMDEDGHAVPGCGGDDCDDTDPTIYEGAEELCDDKDNNCNGSTDEVAPFWYIDCDADGFATDTNGSRQECDEPAPVDSCGWTNMRPSGPESIDCNDANALVFPGQTAFQTGGISGAPPEENFDYNCDGIEARQYGTGGGLIISCSTAFGFCNGTTYWQESDENAQCGFTRTLSYCQGTRLGDCFRTTREERIACR